MSCTVVQTGILVPVDLCGRSLEDFCRWYLRDQAYVKDIDGYDNWTEFMESERDDFVIIEGVIYTIKEFISKGTDENIFIADKQYNGNIKFMLQYYNGGCGFQEALGCAMKNMKEKTDATV
jgi:hypothetical protein